MDRHGVVHRGRIRRLMPVECWRLQGFEKTQFEKVAATGMSDAQLYKQAGNSITVVVVKAIVAVHKKHLAKPFSPGISWEITRNAGIWLYFRETSEGL